MSVTHQHSKQLVPHDESEAIDLHSNQPGDRHPFPTPHWVPLYVFHPNRKGLQVGTLQPTALRERVSAGALEIKFSPIKREVMWVTRGSAHTLTDWVTFLDAVFYFTLLIRATRELLALNLIKTRETRERY